MKKKGKNWESLKEKGRNMEDLKKKKEMGKMWRREDVGKANVGEALQGRIKLCYS